jgi:hypothetical protein
MTIKFDSELKKIEYSINDIISSLEVNTKPYGYRNGIQNLYNSIASFFTGSYSYNFYNNGRSRQIVNEHIDELNDTLDTVYECKECNSILKNNLKKTKDLLDDFKNHLKSYKA